MKYATVSPLLRARLDERVPHFIAGVFVGAFLMLAFLASLLP